MLDLLSVFSVYSTIPTIPHSSRADIDRCFCRSLIANSRVAVSTRADNNEQKTVENDRVPMKSVSGSM